MLADASFVSRVIRYIGRICDGDVLRCGGRRLTSCLSWFCNEKISSPVVQVRIDSCRGIRLCFTLVPSRARIWRKLPRDIFDFCALGIPFSLVKLAILMKYTSLV